MEKKHIFLGSPPLVKSEELTTKALNSIHRFTFTDLHIRGVLNAEYSEPINKMTCHCVAYYKSEQLYSLGAGNLYKNHRVFFQSDTHYSRSVLLNIHQESERMGAFVFNQCRVSNEQQAVGKGACTYALLPC